MVLAIIGFQLLQCGKQMLDVVSRPGMNDIEVKRGQGRALQDRRYATDHDEIDSVLRQNSEHFQSVKVGLGHSSAYGEPGRYSGEPAVARPV